MGHDYIKKLKSRINDAKDDTHHCKNEMLLIEMIDEIERLLLLLEYNETVEFDRFNRRISPYVFSNQHTLSELEKNAMWEGWKLKGLYNEERRKRSNHR